MKLFALLALTVLPALDCATATEDSPWDSFFEALNGPRWKKCRKLQADPCSCRYRSRTVTCAADDSITSISLVKNKLSGAFPVDALALLVEQGLVSIDLSKNPGIDYEIDDEHNCVHVPACHGEGITCVFDVPLCPDEGDDDGDGGNDERPSGDDDPIPEEDTHDGVTPPNFLFILADDMGYGDLGFVYERKQTPFLDSLRLDEHTVLFNNMHSASVSCSPSRAAFITGRNPHRDGVHSANTRKQGTYVNRDGEREYAAAFALSPQVDNLAKLFRASEWDYAIGKFGKWHLSTVQKLGRNHHSLREYGYERAVVSNKAQPTYKPYCFISEDNAQCFINSYAGFEHDAKYEIVGASGYYDQDGNRLGDGDGDYVPGTTSDFLVDQVLDFVDSVLDQSRPFYVELSPHLTHALFVASPESFALCSEGVICEANLGQRRVEYRAALYDLDQAIAKLVSGLQDREVYNNTFLLFTSDNGVESLIDGNRVKFKPSKPRYGSPGGIRDRNGVFRRFSGAKRDLFEGGHRMGGMIRFPALVQGNRETDHLVSHLDLYPTVAELLNVTMNSSVVDGESLVPVLNATAIRRETPLVICDAPPTESSSRPCQMLAVYDNEYKLHTHRKLKKYKLFNLKDDPSETVNLAKRSPEIVDKLKESASQFLESLELGE